MTEPVTVLPGLYQLTIPTPFPVGPVNIYVAREPEAAGLTLIDCGPRTPEARAALDAGLQSLGSSVRDVRRILVTHAHADHYGLAADLVPESGARIFTHPFNRSVLADYADERARRLAFYAGILIEAGVPTDMMLQISSARRGIGEYASSVPVAGELNDGDTLALAGQSWTVLHTPGHSGGLICLFQPAQRLLLSNDHLLRDISSNPLVEPPPPGHSQRLRSLVEYIAQMQRVAALDIAVAWPGHGHPILDVHRLVRQRVAFHNRRAERFLELITAGPQTTYELARHLFQKLDPVNSFLAISEVLGHLELLESRGSIRRLRRGQADLWALPIPG